MLYRAENLIQKMYKRNLKCSLECEWKKKKQSFPHPKKELKHSFKGVLWNVYRRLSERHAGRRLKGLTFQTSFELVFKLFGDRGVPSWENLLHQSKKPKCVYRGNIAYHYVSGNSPKLWMHQIKNITFFKNLPYYNFYLLDRDSCEYMGRQSQRAVLKKRYFYGSLNSPEAANDMTSSCSVALYSNEGVVNWNIQRLMASRMQSKRHLEHHTLFLILTVLFVGKLCSTTFFISKTHNFSRSRAGE